MNFSDYYTENISDYYFDFEDSYNYEILNKVNEELDVICEKATPKQFKEKIESIRKEYFCSARRFLMEYVKGMSKVNEDGSFDIDYAGDVYHFTGAGMDQAVALKDQERNQYIKLLTNIAMDSNEEKDNKEYYSDWRRIFRVAMLWNKNPSILTREDGLKLCHGLNFSFNQAKDFLIRVLENDGFNFASSEDLIETFCFLHIGANNWHTAKRLKEQYQEKTKDIVKISVEEKPERGTELIIENLPHIIHQWEQTVEETTVEEKFMSWLVERAECLDVVSKSSHDIYSKLCRIAYKMILDLEEEEIEFSNDDQLISDRVTDFMERYEEEIQSIAENVSVYDVQKKLVTYAVNEFDNQRIHNQEEYWKSWRYLTIGSDGNLTTQGIGDQIVTLLKGDAFVKKADLLFIIWLICDIYWANLSVSGLKSSFNDRMQDFLNFSEDMLQAAHLPEFYVPHLLEQSMLMSICSKCLSSMGETMEPYEVYQEICEIYAPRRKRKKKEEGDTKEGEEEKKNGEEGEKVSLNQYRLIWESEIKEKFCLGETEYDGTEKIILEHLLKNAAVKKDYVFSPEGISFAPDPAIIIDYPDANIGKKFDRRNEEYQSMEANEERFKYLSAIYLFLQKAVYEKGYKLNCGVYYKATCKISITKWEEKKKLKRS